jgi:hypothetical protein
VWNRWTVHCSGCRTPLPVRAVTDRVDRGSMVGVFSVTDLRKKWVLNKLIYLNTTPKRAAKLGNERKV